MPRERVKVKTKIRVRKEVPKFQPSFYPAAVLDNRAAETHNEVRPVEVRSVEVRPVEVRPVEVLPVEVLPISRDPKIPLLDEYRRPIEPKFVVIHNQTRPPAAFDNRQVQLARQQYLAKVQNQNPFLLARNDKLELMRMRCKKENWVSHGPTFARRPLDDETEETVDRIPPSDKKRAHKDIIPHVEIKLRTAREREVVMKLYLPLGGEQVFPSEHEYVDCQPANFAVGSQESVRTSPPMSRTSHDLELTQPPQIEPKPWKLSCEEGEDGGVACQAGGVLPEEPEFTPSQETGPGIWSELEAVGHSAPKCATAPDIESCLRMERELERELEMERRRTGSPRPSNASTIQLSGRKEHEMTADIINDMISELKTERDSKHSLTSSVKIYSDKQIIDNMMSDVPGIIASSATRTQPSTYYSDLQSISKIAPVIANPKQSDGINTGFATDQLQASRVGGKTMRSPAVEIQPYNYIDLQSISKIAPVSANRKQSDRKNTGFATDQLQASRVGGEIMGSSAMEIQPYNYIDLQSTPKMAPVSANRKQSDRKNPGFATDQLRVLRMGGETMKRSAVEVQPSTYVYTDAQSSFKMASAGANPEQSHGKNTGFATDQLQVSRVGGKTMGSPAVDVQPSTYVYTDAQSSFKMAPASANPEQSHGINTGFATDQLQASRVGGETMGSPAVEVQPSIYAYTDAQSNLKMASTSGVHVKSESLSDYNASMNTAYTSKH